MTEPPPGTLDACQLSMVELLDTALATRPSARWERSSAVVWPTAMDMDGRGVVGARCHEAEAGLAVMRELPFHAAGPIT